MKVYPYIQILYFKTMPIYISVSTRASVFLVFEVNESMNTWDIQVHFILV